MMGMRPIIHFQDEELDDEFHTAHDTMVERSRKKDGTIVASVDTITDLGTLVIINDPEEDDIDTMKSRHGLLRNHTPYPTLLL